MAQGFPRIGGCDPLLDDNLPDEDAEEGRHRQPEGEREDGGAVVEGLKVRGVADITARHPEDFARLEPWAQLWERFVSAEFLRAYRETAGGAPFLPDNSTDFRKLLDVFLLDKALYEILYELNSRPGWVRIPMLGMMSLAT